MTYISSSNQIPENTVLKIEKIPNEDNFVKLTGIEQLSRTRRVTRALAALGLTIITGGFGLKISFVSSLWSEVRHGKVKIDALIKIDSPLINGQIDKINKLQPVLIIKSKGIIKTASIFRFY